jgi:hypothetical protein
MHKGVRCLFCGTSEKCTLYVWFNVLWFEDCKQPSRYGWPVCSVACGTYAIEAVTACADNVSSGTLLAGIIGVTNDFNHSRAAIDPHWEGLLWWEQFAAVGSISHGIPNCEFTHNDASLCLPVDVFVDKLRLSMGGKRVKQHSDLEYLKALHSMMEGWTPSSNFPTLLRTLDNLPSSQKHHDALLHQRPLAMDLLHQLYWYAVLDDLRAVGAGRSLFHKSLDLRLPPLALLHFDIVCDSKFVASNVLDVVGVFLLFPHILNESFYSI